MSQPIKQLYEFGQFHLNAQERLLLRAGEVVPLMPKTLDLLLVLVEAHGHLLEKDELLKRVWPDTFVEEANLSYNISLIRKVLNDGENGLKLIETVPKRGYRFVAEVREVERTEIGATAEEEVRQEPLPTPIKRHSKGALLTLAILVIAMGGTAFGLYKFITRSQTKSSGAEPKIVPLTSLPGQELQPTFSPDGNQIAFVWRNEKDGGSDIYVKSVEAENQQRLTDHPSNEISPAWSPDGRSLAFLRQSPEGNGV